MSKPRWSSPVASPAQPTTARWACLALESLGFVTERVEERRGRRLPRELRRVLERALAQPVAQLWLFEQSDDRVGELVHAADEQTADTIVDGVEMPRNSRRDHRRATRRRLGERQPEALSLRRAGDDPRAPVPIDELVIGDT